ncbi:GGDEF domain-containing protein [Trinickia dabaoshanensis]|uniref:diguanylate cyclase n=1 Tax=Trinickia dabaoshanensis TaxID=564714 RepID=A0A2N7VX21_9BURK|nr:sensor domain-containing diguanylate cyclase [Trinickia dabaoshanensis]PMS21688.1 GGDEF domain-containing protein [Trinickia dabaoshanensis]
MNTITSAPAGDPPRAVRRVTRWYASFLRLAFALLPAYLIAYLYYFQDPRIVFEDHLFHEVAIAAATLEGLFVSYVTWQCYRLSGEPILRWMTLGFTGFVVVYALHGAFTPLAHHHMWLFLLYGPASRLLMAALLFVGLLSYGASADPVERRADRLMWGSWFGVFVVVDLLVAVLANSAIAGALAVRLSLEGGAMLISLLNVACLIVRRIRSPLMQIFGISVMAFALSSLAFILGKPWNHMWWLAHAIFAGGFFLLSYGIVQAFHTTRSFSTIYSQEELLARLRDEMARTHSALQELQRSNQKLESLAAVDSLTGTANRRTFVQRLETEVAAAKRGGAPFSLLAVDVDNLQRINERFGERMGDSILRAVATACTDAMRPHQGIARVGGGEFMALVPHAALDAALMIGERLRTAIQSLQFEGGQERFSVTASVGIAQFGPDGTTADAVMRAADERLKRAKTHGRNCVIAV